MERLFFLTRLNIILLTHVPAVDPFSILILERGLNAHILAQIVHCQQAY
jgi:hypothetical protein